MAFAPPSAGTAARWPRSGRTTLAALVVAAAVSRAGLGPASIDEVVLGAANQAGEDNRNVARMAVLLAGLPPEVPGYTVNRLCASGLTAVAAAAQAVRVLPHLMGLGPVPASEKVLARTGWSTADLDAVELNEAFAVQALACIARLDLDPDVVNADGGAIALGHPLGCSGARLVVTLLGRLDRTAGRRGLATLCVGVGQGVSMLVERP